MIDTKWCWYDYSRILSYKRPINYIVGIRGKGKTYGAKLYCLTRYQKYQKQFVYVRRYDTQLLECKNKFLADIKSDERLKGHQYQVDGDKVYEILENKRIVVGYFIALSRYETYKSSSFADVDTIVFDEFITAERYLPNEVFKFADLCETILRHRDGKIFMLSNSLSVVNPYFESMGVRSLNQAFTKSKDWVIHYDSDEDFAQQKRKTVVGRVFGDTEWASYAYDNKFALDNTTNVGEIKCSKETLYNLMLNGNRIGCYYANGLLYFGTPFIGKTYTPYVDDCKDNVDVILVKPRDRHIFTIYEKYVKGLCYFENLSIKNEITLICRKLGRNF